MAPFTKYLPHLGVTALIIFLAVDYFPPDQKLIRPLIHSVEKLQLKEEGGRNEGSHHGRKPSRRVRKGPTFHKKNGNRRMGIFHYNEGNKFFKERKFCRSHHPLRKSPSPPQGI